MFTGIVEETGKLAERTREAGGQRLQIQTGFAPTLSDGQSVCVDGVCLTVETTTDIAFEVFTATETLEKTSLAEIPVGTPVNLERAMPADGRFDGHIVQGHVDTTTTITEIESVGDDWLFQFDLPPAVARYIVSKGSITIDGISLTVADLEETTFSVAIVPTTYETTNLCAKAVGDTVHLEVDVLAKYVERLLDT